MSNRVVDLNGWWEVKANPITKCGVFPYLGSEIGAPVADKVYMVYRPAEELQRQETLDSFKLLPFIDEHTPLGAYGIPAEQKGISGAIGEQVFWDDPYIRANIKVLSSAAIAQIGSGKIELSPGYSCKYEFTPGSFEGVNYDAVQRHIRGNHLALVAEGRTGPDVAMLDGKPLELITIDSKEAVPMEFTPEQLAQIKALLAEMIAGMQTVDADPAKADPAKPTTDATPEEEAAAMAAAAPVVSEAEGTAAEEAVAVAEEAQAALEEAQVAVEEVAAAAEEIVMAADAKSKKIAQDKLTVAKSKLAAAKQKQKRIAQDSASKGLLSTVDKLTKRVEELTKSQKPMALDHVAIMRQVEERNELASQVSEFIGTFDHKNMTIDQVGEYAAKNIGLTADSGQAVAVVRAWLHGRTPARHQTITADSAKGSSLKGEWAKQAEGK